MSRLPNEDLFEGSKMTFGEHLEELRVALFKSLMGLAVGCVFGFLMTNQVIEMVERPLIKALKQYYSKKMKQEVTARYGQDMSAEDLKLLQTSVENDGRVFEDVYFEAAEIRRLSQLVAIGEGQGSTSNPTSEATDGTDEGEAEPAETRDESGESKKATSNETNRSPASALQEPGIPDLSNMVKTRIWKDSGYKIQSINATEPFVSWMKVGIITGLTLSMPWIFYQLWIFVAEGLYPSEKKYVYIYLPFSLALFFLGAGIAFFFVFEPVLGFLFSFNEVMNSDPEPRISEWLSFFMLLPLGFGIGFQLPLVMLFLNRIGIVSVETYQSQWRIAVLIIFFAAMLLTPADPQSMLLLALPLTVLYFLGILLCQYLPRSESPFGEGYDPS